MWTCCTQVIRVSIYEVVSAFLITPLPRLTEKSQTHFVTLLGIIVIISHIQSQRLTQINSFKVTVGIELGSIGLFCFTCKEKQWQMEPQTYALVCKGHASSGSWYGPNECAGLLVFAYPQEDCSCFIQCPLLASLCRKLIDVKNWGVILLCFLHLHFQYPRVRKFFCNMILLVDCFWVSHYISWSHPSLHLFISTFSLYNLPFQNKKNSKGK